RVKYAIICSVDTLLRPLHAFPTRRSSDLLIHLDMDAIKAYEQAIKACEHASIANQLRSFQGDHQRHVRDLSAELTRLGEKPDVRSEEHTSELQSLRHLVCRLLLEKKKEQM